LHPGDDFSQEVGRPLSVDNWTEDGVLGEPEPAAPSLFVAGAPHARADNVLMPADEYAPAPVAGAGADDEHSDDEKEFEFPLAQVMDNIKHLHIAGFRGKASGATLYKQVLTIKHELVGGGLYPVPNVQRPEFWSMPKVRVRSAPFWLIQPIAS
jgi:hypothetical protein